MRLRNHHSKARRSTRGILELLKDRARLRHAPACASCLIVLMSLAGPSARAQIENADAFFNSGAQFYISNNIPAALERTETGLKLYPDDVKLKKLEQLLKQQQQQQSQQQQKNNQSQKNQSPQSQQQSQNQQQRQNDQEKQKQQQDQSARQKQQEQQQQNRQSAGKKEDEQKAAPAGQMTPQEAQRLLDAQKENEQFLQLKPNAPPRSKQPAEDW